MLMETADVSLEESREGVARREHKVVGQHCRKLVELILDDVVVSCRDAKRGCTSHVVVASSGIGCISRLRVHMWEARRELWFGRTSLSRHISLVPRPHTELLIRLKVRRKKVC